MILFKNKTIYFVTGIFEIDSKYFNVSLKKFRLFLALAKLNYQFI